MRGKMAQVKVYHITSVDNVPKILQEGLKCDAEGNIYVISQNRTELISGRLFVTTFQYVALSLRKFDSLQYAVFSIVLDFEEYKDKIAYDFNYLSNDTDNETFTRLFKIHTPKFPPEMIKYEGAEELTPIVIDGYISCLNDRLQDYGI